MLGVPLGNISPLRGADFSPMLEMTRQQEGAREFDASLQQAIAKLLQDNKQAELNRQAQLSMNTQNQNAATSRAQMEQDAISARLGQTQQYQSQAQAASQGFQRDMTNQQYARQDAASAKAEADRKAQEGKANADLQNAADVEVQAGDIINRIVQTGMAGQLSNMPGEAGAIAAQVYPQDAVRQAALIQSLNQSAQQYMKMNPPAPPPQPGPTPQEQLKQFTAQLQMELMKDQAYAMAYQEVDKLNAQMQQLDAAMNSAINAGNGPLATQIQQAMQKIQEAIDANAQMAENRKQALAQQLLAA